MTMFATTANTAMLLISYTKLWHKSTYQPTLFHLKSHSDEKTGKNTTNEVSLITSSLYYLFVLLSETDILSLTSSASLAAYMTHQAAGLQLLAR